MSRAEEGLKSEHLTEALSRALAGDGARLADLLARFGGLPGPRPNHALAAAFGDVVGALDGELRARAAKVLTAIGADDAAPDTARVFLPVAAAFGWTARLRTVKSRGDVAAAERALMELAADERAPVRAGAIAALVEHAARGHADALVVLMGEQLAEEDRERRWGALGTLLEAFTDKRAIASLTTGRDALLEHVTALIVDLADAPRAAERSDARRRALLALGPAVSAMTAAFRDVGIAWLEARCSEAKHPDLRRSLDTALSRLRARGDALRPEELARLGEALASSAKPPRDPSRIRDGTGRGKKRARRGA